MNMKIFETSDYNLATYFCLRPELKLREIKKVSWNKAVFVFEDPKNKRGEIEVLYWENTAKFPIKQVFEAQRDLKARLKAVLNA